MTATLRPLAALLVESVRGDRGALPAGAAEESVADVLYAGDLHRVSPAIRRRIAGVDGVDSWRAGLDQARAAQLFRHLQGVSDLRVMTAAFGPDVRWAAAKGVVLADLVWPHPDMRMHGDVDVYVHPADFLTGLRALESAGFTLVDRNWPELRSAMRSELALRGPSGMMVDLHWDLLGGPDRRRELTVDLPAMLSRTRRATLGSGLEIPVFEGTDMMLHVALHAAASGSNRLMWLGDLYHVARRQDVDWDEFARRAVSWRAAAPVALTVARVERVFDTSFPLPRPLRRSASRTAWARLAARRDRRRPFPGLPGDASLGGSVYAAARPTLLGSVGAAVQDALRVRRIEARIRRRGPEANPLDLDVPDADARRSYLAAVAAAAG